MNVNLADASKLTDNGDVSPMKKVDVSLPPANHSICMAKLIKGNNFDLSGVQLLETTYSTPHHPYRYNPKGRRFLFLVGGEGVKHVVKENLSGFVKRSFCTKIHSR